MRNDDWKQTQESEIRATGLAPSDDHEAATLTILPSGPFTVIVREANGAGGIALMEIYKLDQLPTQSATNSAASRSCKVHAAFDAGETICRVAMAAAFSAAGNRLLIKRSH